MNVLISLSNWSPAEAPVLLSIIKSVWSSTKEPSATITLTKHSKAAITILREADYDTRVLIRFPISRADQDSLATLIGAGNFQLIGIGTDSTRNFYTTVSKLFDRIVTLGTETDPYVFNCRVNMPGRIWVPRIGKVL